jgi:hypothetical protein
MTDAERVILLRAALRPFASEGRKWTGTNPAFDDLTLLCAEDYPHMTRWGREADFTIGDFKRAVAAYDYQIWGVAEHTLDMIRCCEGVVVQAWRRVLCQVGDYHHWVDVGLGRPEYCSVCRIGVWA